MSANIRQMDLVLDILKLLKDRYGVKEVNNRHINAAIEAATDITKALNTPHKPSVPGSGLEAWLACDGNRQIVHVYGGCL